MANKKEKTYVINLPLYDGCSPDEYVSVNNKEYKIQRGVDVPVPESVYILLSMKRDQDAANLRRAIALQQ